MIFHEVLFFSPGMLVAHAVLLQHPDVVIVLLWLFAIQQPGAVGAARAHSTTAVVNHAVEPEVLRVVVIQIVCPILYMWKIFRALREADTAVQPPAPVEEIRDGRVEEVWLVLVPSLTNTQQRRVQVSIAVKVEILDFAGVHEKVVGRKVEAACFAAARAKRDLKLPRVGAFETVEHLHGVHAGGQPLLVPRARWHLVVPSSWSHMLRLERPLVLGRTGAGEVMQAQGHTVSIHRRPVDQVIQVGLGLVRAWGHEFLLKVRQGRL
mmetsp:Transcript_73526/g.172219  ORF Transcript_73526/g.172219 Transcript_73526/m.172219 type:complete len:265 (+) Transcript_73526:1307-2101(+)